MLIVEANLNFSISDRCPEIGKPEDRENRSVKIQDVTVWDLS